MNNRMLHVTHVIQRCLLPGLLLVTTLIHVSGFAGALDAPVPSARGAGMGGVMGMLTGDPTSASINPAVLTYMEGTQFSIGTTVVVPDFRFTPAANPNDGTKMHAQALFPPNISLAHTFPGGFGLGVSVANPYSVKTDWGIEWPGRRVIAGSEIRGFTVTPMASFHLTRSVALGAGLNITSFRFARSARVAAPTQSGSTGLEGTERLQGTGTPAYGLQLGVLVAPDDIFTFGMSYRSRSRIVIESGAITYEWPSQSSYALPPSEFSVSFTLPDRFRGGVGFRPFDFILIAGELEFVRWSSIDRMVVEGTANGQIVEQQGWDDALAAHAGVEIDLGHFMLRAGMILDRSPISDEQLRPSIPDADRRVYTVGIGYAIADGLTMDVAVQSVHFDQRTVTNSAIKAADGAPLNGTYDLSATNVCLNVSYLWK